MTIVSTASMTDATAALVAEVGGSSSNQVDIMIGIGLVKDSEAVFFQYLGEEQQPSALMMPSGKPLTRLSNIKLAGIDIAEGVGEFKSTKLNLFLESNQGRIIMLTSGLGTIWSQCLITGLIEVLNIGDLNAPIVIDSWKGTSKMKPCFAAVRQNGAKLSNTELYEELGAARAKRDTVKRDIIMKDAVDTLAAAFGVVPGDVVVETVDTDSSDY